MKDERGLVIVDTLTLRFDGEDQGEGPLHELYANHVADVLQGLTELAKDFDDAGVFHEDGPSEAAILVRPPRDGSFIIEVVRAVVENPEMVSAAAVATGTPTLGNIVWWATKSARADVSDFVYLDNGNVKVTWQDNTVDEVPPKAWDELNKRKRRRKKQLRQIMAPLQDPRVDGLDLTAVPEIVAGAEESYELTPADFEAVRPDDEIEEVEDHFEVEAWMSAIDFDDPTKWKVKSSRGSRTVRVEDQKFLKEVEMGLAISRDDVFHIHVDELIIKKNGRRTTTWTVKKVERGRRQSRDDVP